MRHSKNLKSNERIKIKVKYKFEIVGNIQLYHSFKDNCAYIFRHGSNVFF